MKKLLPRLRVPPGRRLGGSVSIALSLVFTVAAAAAGVLGLVGILALNRSESFHLNALDVAHGVIQLYTGQDPKWLTPDAEEPIPYDIAKVIAPMSTAYAFVGTAVMLLSERWRLLRARRARGHAIVCGGGRAGVFLSRVLAADGTTVFIDADAATEQVATSLVRRVIPLSGDIRDTIVLERAGIRRALVVFAIAEKQELNAAVAMSVRRLVAGRDVPMNCYAVVDSPELQIAMQARILSSRREPAFRLHLLERDQLFASAVMRADPPDPRGQSVVVGDGPIAHALAVEAARALMEAGVTTSERPTLCLAGRRPDDVLAALRGRVPGVADQLRLGVWAQTAQVPEEPRVSDRGGADTVYVAGPTDQETITTGYRWLSAESRVDRRVVLCLEAESGLAEVMEPAPARRTTEGSSLLRVHSRTLALADPEHLKSQSFVEKLARALHKEYTEQVSGSGDAFQPWEAIPEVLKEANRDQAAHVGSKLASLRCVVAPFGNAFPPFAFTEVEIEDLARQEHKRWVAERARAGLRQGPERTSETHPDMVAWADLGESARDKDRIFIRALPRILGREGLVIVRLPRRDPRPQGDVEGRQGVIGNQFDTSDQKGEHST